MTALVTEWEQVVPVDFVGGSQLLTCHAIHPLVVLEFDY